MISKYLLRTSFSKLNGTWLDGLDRACHLSVEFDSGTNLGRHGSNSPQGS